MVPSLPLLYSVVVGSSVPLVAAKCQWSMLQNAVDSYIDSQSTGNLSSILKSGSVKYQENNREMDINKGILSKPLKVNHTHTIFDQDGCATFTELIVTDPDNPYVIGTQLRYNDTAGSFAVSLVDTIATTTGDWLFNASKTLEYVLQENWNTISADSRDSRETLKAGADAYLDLWGNPNATVPWGTPCTRLEGSAYTGKGLPTDSCNVGIPGGDQPPVSNRRYVIDETVGSVSVLCTFETMKNAPDSHEFRLENGKLRYVHTMTVMRQL